MAKKRDLTTGSVKKTLILFVLPYLLACFLQAFYGIVDLYVVGRYNASETTTAVAIGSQVMHMLTVMVVGMAMGSTVGIGRAVGAKDSGAAKKMVGTTIVFFAGLAIFLTIVLIAVTNPITHVMRTPQEAVSETNRYLRICFAGLPFIIAYNVISSIFRGAGDSKSPMIFVAISCAVNIALDYVLIGGFHMGAAGAALGTVCGQAVSVLAACLSFKKIGLGFRISRKDIRLNRQILSSILKVGIPISSQDGLIQVSFIVITAIANSRGLIASTSVGIVEKVISFLFLVPSAFLSAISAVTAQNMGAGKPDRARSSLRFGMAVSVSWGILCFVVCQAAAGGIVGLFSKDAAVVAAGAVYLHAYSLDCVFAAIHFCFSGYFCGDQKSIISFVHNIVSIAVVRIPGAYLASRIWPETLYPMGLAAPLGSLLSALICVGFYVYFRKKESGIKQA